MLALQQQQKEQRLAQGRRGLGYDYRSEAKGSLHLAWLGSTALICLAMVLSSSAMAQNAEVEGTHAVVSQASTPAPISPKKRAQPKSNKVVRKKTVQPVAGIGHDPHGLSPEDQVIAAAYAASPARLDKVYGTKGWNIPFPSYGDTLLQDYGGWRSKLAESGFGLLAFSTNIFQVNTLTTPNKVPAASFVPALGISLPYAVCPAPSGSQTPCAGKQLYLGERPQLLSDNVGALTYDTSRWGIPDGQIAVGGTLIKSTEDQDLRNNWLTITTLSWYQTLFNKTLEVQIGLQSLSQQFVATALAGNFANTFGPAASIPAEFGLSQASGTPTARVNWHITDALYNEFAVARSQPIDGPSNGGPFWDESTENPSGLRFSVPHAGALLIDEIGYENQAAPGSPLTWARFGTIYNFSNFANFSQLTTNPTAVTRGSSAVYFLADRQFWQQAPASPFTAYRGIYGGVSAMYGPPQTAEISQYYEARAYWIGALDWRPTDLASFVWAHNVFSHYLADQLNPLLAPLVAQGFPEFLNRHASNSYTFSYLAHLLPGVYASVGVSYTDHPSLFYFKNEGSALSFLSSLTVVF
jgi:porin